MKKILLILALSFLNINVQAAYQVEIIIFEHLFHDAEGEVSHVGLKIPDLSNTVQLSSDTIGHDAAFRLLPSSMYKLGGVYSELRSSREYKPILHLAWQQPQLTQSRSKYVHIRKADGIAQQDESDDALVKLDGVIRIRSSQFLHADVDLFYFINELSESFISANAGTLDSSQIQAEFVELNETRRMKLNELHYFDHPVFGMLVRVSRLSPEQ
ncbi:MAG: hypothetical protein A2W76_09795 [Gammaproteobacteria bacterium RIFCSPLOWO2_12_47_11]|nr:MAG: hypothetical protein A2W76_09795 [Gammaproteobacteria bacterium RIFCSPLOWO2_12_47_11]